MKGILFVFVISTCCAFGQNIRDTVISAPLFSASYAFQIPGGNLSERFGVNNNIGFSAGIKHHSNWQFEVEGTFFFSSNVKDTAMLTPLNAASTNIKNEYRIIDQFGEYNPVLLFERGFTITANLGRVFPVFGPNPNSGIIAKIGIGTIWHRVRIDNQGNEIPQLAKNNLPYYDRKTLGVAFKQYIGYQHLSNSRLTNFNIGFEIYEGLTEGIRDYQIDIMGPYKNSRLDILYGIRVGWIVPVYRKAPSEFYID